MKMIIDGDSCPVLDLAVKIAKAKAIEVIIVCNYEHRITSDYGTVFFVDKGPDSADFAIANRTLPGDLVITQDYGLAAMILSKQASVIHPSGRIIHSGNIDQLLDQRHFSKEQRRKHGARGPRFKPRTAEDDKQFELALLSLLAPTY